MTKTQKICARDANIACITTTDFLSFFMSTIINESNNNCFSFFKPWLTKFLSSSRPGFGLYLSCLLYFYFLSWRDDVLQWCHIHNLHSTTYVHNHTNTMWVYFTSETLCLLSISECLYIFCLSSSSIPFFSFLVIPLAFHLDPLWYADKRQDDLDKRIIIRIVEEAHIYVKTPKLLYNNSILYYFSYYKNCKRLDLLGSSTQCWISKACTWCIINAMTLIRLLSATWPSLKLSYS